MSAGFGRVLLVAAVVGVAWYAMRRPAAESPQSSPAGSSWAAESPLANSGHADFTQAASGTQMRVGGHVERLLADDNDGSRHQRFIIRTDAGTTLLIAHNIDLAPRLDGLAAGDTVVVYGEYEWNDKGGLIHWTHKDPGGKHAAGHIEWRGRRYQ